MLVISVRKLPIFHIIYIHIYFLCVCLCPFDALLFNSSRFFYLFLLPGMYEFVCKDIYIFFLVLNSLELAFVLGFNH